MEWKRGPQPPAAGDVASPEALVGVIEELMNTVRCDRLKPQNLFRGASQLKLLMYGAVLLLERWERRVGRESKTVAGCQ